MKELAVGVAALFMFVNEALAQAPAGRPPAAQPAPVAAQPAPAMSAELAAVRAKLDALEKEVVAMRNVGVVLKGPFESTCIVGATRCTFVSYLCNRIGYKSFDVYAPDNKPGEPMAFARCYNP